jgi:hypothetical protein
MNKKLDVKNYALSQNDEKSMGKNQLKSYNYLVCDFVGKINGRWDTTYDDYRVGLANVIHMAHDYLSLYALFGRRSVANDNVYGIMADAQKARQYARRRKSDYAITD